MLRQTFVPALFRLTLSVTSVRTGDSSPIGGAKPCLSLWERCPSAHTGAERVSILKGRVEMKAIVSVFARDSKGIIAYVTALLAEKDINVLDISQTLLQEYFAMIMLVDLTDCGMSFVELSRYLADKGQERGLDIHIQRQDIFDAMHKV